MCFFKPFLIIANKALEEKLQEMNCNSDKNLTALKERVQVLEKELDNANELLSSSKLRGLFFLPCFWCVHIKDIYSKSLH